ncbi:MAG TPA: sporulation integral membrane protein YtvI [Anaerovoracaceae bacterium]|nr:sporulation integral membrane protein YtvI [Anaerovoracaceae bacterium]
MDYKKKLKYVIYFMYYSFIIGAVYLLLQYGLGLIAPFIVAFIIAYILRRPAKFCSERLKIPYKLAAFLFVLLFYCTIGTFIALIGIKLFSTFADLVLRLPSIYNLEIEPYLISLYQQIEKEIYQMDPALISIVNEYFNSFIQSLGALISSLSVTAVGAVSGVASSLPVFFIKLLLMVISSFFIAGDYDLLVNFVLRQFSGKGKELVIQIKEYIVGTLFVCIRSYALIMSITFVELSIGLSIIGVKNSILIALVISVFDILPVLGTGGIMIPWTIITALQGSYIMAVGLLAVYLTITVIRNILEPKIVGSQIGLHPVVTLISMFVGVQLFGVIGLFGFPITLSLLRHLNSTGAIKLFR